LEFFKGCRTGPPGYRLAESIGSIPGLLKNLHIQVLQFREGIRKQELRKGVKGTAENTKIGLQEEHLFHDYVHVSNSYVLGREY
jgi:hypothetical protein